MGPRCRAGDAQLVKWLMEDQKESGVFAGVTELVDLVSGSPAAKMVAEEIAARAQVAQEKAGTVGGRV